MRNKGYLFKMNDNEHQAFKEGARRLGISLADYIRCGLFAIQDVHLQGTREVR
jgi:hypothetical protein